VSSGARVEDGGVLKDGLRRCPGLSGRSDGGRWKCLENLLSVGRERAVAKIFRTRAPNTRHTSIMRVSHLTDGRHVK
jgi:hypothetical protein